MIFRAKVIAGEGRGKKIGFPTANLNKTDLEIDFGVYLARARVGNQEFAGLLHFGPQKTFGARITAELHLKDFSGDLYGKEVQVEIISKVREIKKFANINELKTQITQDLDSIA